MILDEVKRLHGVDNLSRVCGDDPALYALVTGNNAFVPRMRG